MDVLGGEVPRAVQGDRGRAAEGLEGGQRARLAQSLNDLVVERVEFLRGHVVERVADMVVTRDVLDLEQGLRVALALALRHGFLGGQERRALGVEHRERAQADIFHRVCLVLARAPVMQSAYAFADRTDELIEPPQTHAHSLRRKSGKRGRR